jgi:hypothetical protein
MIINDPAVLPGLEGAFDLYENALMANDISTLGTLFHAAQETVRFGIGEMLYGCAEIAAFRRARPGGLAAKAHFAAASGHLWHGFWNNAYRIPASWQRADRPPEPKLDTHRPKLEDCGRTCIADGNTRMMH